MFPSLTIECSLLSSASVGDFDFSLN